MSIRSFVLLLSLAASVSALATPHAPRNSHHHNLAARIAPSVAVPPIVDAPVVALRKRASGKRCKSRPVSSPTVPVANVAPAPTNVPTSSSEPAPPKQTTKPHVDAPKPTTSPEPTTSPKPTTTPAPKPTTTTTQDEPTSSPTKPPPVSKPPSSGGSNLPSFMTGTQTGQGTFYATGLGACGIVNSDTDYIAAVSHLLFDAFPGYTSGNPNKNPLCGKKVQVQYEGKSVVVALTDRCEGCQLTDLDFSPSAFNQLASPSVGRISNIKWTWL